MASFLRSQFSNTLNGSQNTWRDNAYSSTILNNSFWLEDPLSKTISIAYVLEAPTPLTITSNFSYELETAAQLSQTTNFSYALLAGIPALIAQTPVLTVSQVNASSFVAQTPLLVVAVNVNAELSLAVVSSYTLQTAFSLGKFVSFSYELEQATELSKAINFSYELLATTDLSVTISSGYSLDVAANLTATIQSSYSLNVALDLSKAIVFSYELQNAVQLSKLTNFSYELTASTPLTIISNFSYELEVALALFKPITFSYVLDASLNLSKTIQSSFELEANAPITKTFNFSYELETALPLVKLVNFSYELSSALALSKTDQFSYELTASTPLTKTIALSYELLIEGLSRTIAFEYELIANPEISSGIVSSYELSSETLTKTVTSSYTIFQNTLGSLIAQSPVLVVSKVTGQSQIAQTPILVLAIPKRPSQITQTPLTVVNKKRSDFDLTYLHPQSPVDEIWQFKTTVNKSTQGQEQRMSVRAAPRLAVKFDYLLDDPGNLATLKYLHNAMQRGRVLYPLHHYGARVLTGAGSNVLTLANRGLAYAVGQSVGMQGIDGAWHVTTLSAVAGNVVTLAAIPANPANWQYASLYPMAFARATGDLSLQLGRGENSAELEVMIDASQPLQFAPYAFGLINALPFLDLPFIINGAQNLETSLETDWRDVGSNAASAFVLMSQPEISATLEFNVKCNELQKLGAVLKITRGKLNPFYVALTQNLFEGCTVLNGDLIASNAMLHDLSLLADNTFLLLNKSLAVKIVDRFYNYNLQGEVIGATLKTSPQIPANFATSFVQQLLKVRLDSDDFSVTHTDNYLQLKLKARTLPNEF